jgi:hypothetical protein
MKMVHYLKSLKIGRHDRVDWVYRAIHAAIQQTDEASCGHLKSHMGKSNHAERKVSSQVFRWCVCKGHSQWDALSLMLVTEQVGQPCHSSHHIKASDTLPSRHRRSPPGVGTFPPSAQTALEIGSCRGIDVEASQGRAFRLKTLAGCAWYM